MSVLASLYVAFLVYISLEPSIGVLRRIGFVAVAGPDPEGIIRFERSRPE